MYLNQLHNVQTGLSATPASVTGFTIPALLVDHEDVPIDVRYRTVSRSSYADDLTASTDQVSWCASLWGQNYNPALAYICRWVSAASSPYFVRGAAAETNPSTWAAVTDGSLTVTTTAGADALTTIDFTGDTSLTDVAATIDAKLVAGGSSGARCYLDALDRIYFIDPAVTGAGSDTVVLSGGGGGTDLYLAAWLDGANGWAQGGLDIEALGTAQAAALAKTNNAPYAWCQRGGSIAQVTAFSTANNSLNKYLFLRNDDPVSKTATTTDYCYAIRALLHNRTHICYTEHTTDVGAAADQNPDAAAIGEILVRPNKEGAVNYAATPLTGVSESGLSTDLTTVIPLTDGERGYLEGKGADYLIQPLSPNPPVHLRNGLAVGGQEVRVMVGRDWFNQRIMEDFYGYFIAQEVVTFSDRHLAALKGFIVNRSDTLVDRQCLEEGYTIEMPLASSFTAVEKATHTLTLSDFYDADVQIAINDTVVSMTWSV